MELARWSQHPRRRLERQISEAEARRRGLDQLNDGEERRRLKPLVSEHVADLRVREIRVTLRRGDRRTRPGDGLVEARIPREIDPYDDGAHEVADDVVEPDVLPGVDVGRHEELVLTVVLHYRGAEGSENNREERCALAAGELLEPPAKRGRDLEGLDAALGTGRARITREGRLERRRRVGKVVTPVADARLVAGSAPAEPRALPYGEVGVLQPGLGQGRASACHERSIEQVELVEEDSERAAVSGDVVEGQRPGDGARPRVERAERGWESRG